MLLVIQDSKHLFLQLIILPYLHAIDIEMAWKWQVALSIQLHL
jgi:hypothetical protein